MGAGHRDANAPNEGVAGMLVIAGGNKFACRVRPSVPRCEGKNPLNARGRVSTSAGTER